MLVFATARSVFFVNRYSDVCVFLVWGGVSDIFIYIFLCVRFCGVSRKLFAGGVVFCGFWRNR